MTGSADVSVVIRNRNESRYLRKVLTALSMQHSPVGEVIVVDNESTDDSVAVAKSFGARIVPIASGDFTYGRALNVGIAAARRPLVLILSAHSVPVGPSFVARAIEPFADPLVAATNCLNSASTGELAEWTTERRIAAPAAWESLFRDGLINRAAVIRRDLWCRFPFHESLVASEDTLWSHQVIDAGYAIQWTTACYVYLQRRPFFSAVRKRHREALANYQLSGVRPPVRLGRVVGAALLRAPKAALRAIAQESLLACSAAAIALSTRVVPPSALPETRTRDHR